MKATEYNIQEEGLDRITAIALCATLCEGDPEPDFLTINTRKQMERTRRGGGKTERTVGLTFVSQMTILNYRRKIRTLYLLLPLDL